jgi:3-hydroxybutyryl-CoA dehydrogenase
VAEIRTIAVIGAGAVGRGIAHAAALGGYRTVLEDILPASLRKAEGEIRASIERAREQGVLGSEDAGAALARIEYASSVESASRQADLVIEAVPDEWESKMEIFTLLDKICKPRAIFASNTSVLSVTELASVTYRPHACLGMRFSQPVQEMKILALVRGEETDNETIAACMDVGRRMGKEVAVIDDFFYIPSRQARDPYPPPNRSR